MEIEEMKDVLEKVAELAADKTVEALRKNRMLDEDGKTPFQKTEALLYNYNAFKKAVELKERQIETILKQGIPKKSKSITSYSSNGGIFEQKMEEEKLEEKIAEINRKKDETIRYIQIIDEALEQIKNDKYYKIIVLKYMKGKTREQIAEIFEKDESTISRNKNRLIRMLQVYIFSEEVGKKMIGM